MNEPINDKLSDLMNGTQMSSRHQLYLAAAVETRAQLSQLRRPQPPKLKSRHIIYTLSLNKYIIKK